MIIIENLSKNYEELNVLDKISLTINDGEIYGLVGRSGAGKSTLLRCINGLENFQEGNVLIDNVDVKSLGRKEIRKFRKDIGMIFQHFSILERKTVYDNIALPMECWKVEKSQIDKKVHELVELVDIKDKLNIKAKNLSGGQKQRVAIARALAMNPKILLCDEATSALDPRTTKDILSLLRKINEELKITIVIVTHQMSVVRQLCTKVALLENGKIVENGDVREIFINQSAALQRLLGAESCELPEGCNYQIMTTEIDKNETLLSMLAMEIQVPFSVIDGRIEHFRNDKMGKFVINFDNKYEENFLLYFKQHNIIYKKVDDEMESLDD
ncbi:methionine ABC transporter ATP-binding protein [Clostridium drakei]|uniref:ABC transporter ATP-binding protein n=1 Tax=Clostridium drakei TaxID=332101 RepID=A0A2U8DTQ7_9CLOT|nr:methionine ABC transporter ATP-binding protein [Clostridium drakei]AWI06137.1 ABC transporter ATP-binding protein [Clostridium drakei]